VLTEPEHEYTRRLVAADPALHSTRIVEGREEEPGPPRIEIRDLVKTYRVKEDSGRRLQKAAVDHVSASVRRGETLAVVGESGSGKTTLARAVLRLLQVDSGQILYEGRDVLPLKRNALRNYRRLVQPIFQDPSGSLNPRFTVYDAIVEPFIIQRIGDSATRQRRAVELLDHVELPRSAADRRTTELSGGQKQRVAIARALALVPEMLVCDEVVSALDVIVQEQILELLTTLQREYGLTYLFISHDLAVVRQIADKVIVMQDGKVVEEGEVEQVFRMPTSDYTKELLAAIPGQRVIGAST
jgi:peptide/nickel transport system ATP-binding protein